MVRKIAVLLFLVFGLCTAVRAQDGGFIGKFSSELAELMRILMPARKGCEPLRPFPQHVDYGDGVIIPSIYSRSEMDEHVKAFYDYWKSQYLVEAGVDDEGHKLYRIAMGHPGSEAHEITVSEGQGYGMIILAVMAGYEPRAREIFDGLWRYARAHPSDIDGRLMAGRVPPDPEGNDSAFDGDADMAFALLLAHRQWGDCGEIDYLKEAKTLIKAVMESTIGPDSRLPMLGDWVNPYGRVYNQYTNRLSDFMIANFRSFAGVEDGWSEVIERCYEVMEYLQQTYSPDTGLLPDFVEPESPSSHRPRPASPYFLESEFDGDYYYNSCRVPLRLGMDAVLNRSERSKEIVLRISHWAQKATHGEPGRFRAGYTLDGVPLPDSDYFSAAFVAPLGVAAMNDPQQQKWLDAIYEAVKDVHQDYYEDSLTLLSLLVMTGNFWLP